MRPEAVYTHLDLPVFQSTHPSWGATRFIGIEIKGPNDFNPRTHRGVRLLAGQWGNGDDRFQSTHPSWGATLLLVKYIHTLKFISIHAPIVGCDNKDISTHIIDLISIHAPIVGCDRFGPMLIPFCTNFNPRTHRGVRLDTLSRIFT